MVLCDLSSHNPNVFFELGVRTSLNLPVALVKDERTSIPFDTSGINTLSYTSSLKAWDISKGCEALTEFLKKSITSCAGENPLWRHFGLTKRANEPHSDESPTDARLDLLTAKVEQLQALMPSAWDVEADLDIAMESLAATRSRIAYMELQKKFIHMVYEIPRVNEHINGIGPGKYGNVEVRIRTPFPKWLHEQIMDLAHGSQINVTFSKD